MLLKPNLFLQLLFNIFLFCGNFGYGVSGGFGYAQLPHSPGR